MGGEFIILPGATDLSFQVGKMTAFLSMKEAFQLLRTIDTQATKVWGEEWINLFKVE